MYLGLFPYTSSCASTSSWHTNASKNITVFSLCLLLPHPRPLSGFPPPLSYLFPFYSFSNAGLRINRFHGINNFVFRSSLFVSTAAAAAAAAAAASTAHVAKKVRKKESRPMDAGKGGPILPEKANNKCTVSSTSIKYFRPYALLSHASSVTNRTSNFSKTDHQNDLCSTLILKCKFLPKSPPIHDFQASTTGKTSIKAMTSIDKAFSLLFHRRKLEGISKDCRRIHRADASFPRQLTVIYSSSIPLN